MALASDVMDRVAAVCLNDPSKGTYNYAVQLPLLKAAWEELAQILTSVNIPVVKETSVPLLHLASDHILTPPADIFYPVALFERAVGETDEHWIRMKEHAWDRKRIASEHTTLDFWVWREQVFEVGVCSIDREVYCEYYKDITLQIANPDSQITIINTVNALAFRTAELCSRYIGSNTDRANDLAVDYKKAIDLITTIGIKKNQSIVTRRKPYRLKRTTTFPRN